MTFVAAAVLTAAQLNTHLRDNTLETMPAKATAPLRHFVASGTNAIVERHLDVDIVDAREITSTGAYIDLATVGPTVTVATGSRALVMYTVTTDNTVAASVSSAAPAISGATTASANFGTALIVRHYLAATEKRMSMAELFSGLTPGNNTFTLKYYRDSGTASFSKREMTVWAF
jgi:hypothetical protein